MPIRLPSGAVYQLKTAGPSNRLRLSLFDFNPSFITRKHFERGKRNGYDLDTALLDAFAQARIDDYSLVQTIVFRGHKAGNANPPDWDSNFNPAGEKTDALRTTYLQQLTSEMHARNVQVIAGYELVTRGVGRTAEGDALIDWLNRATSAQIIAHAADIAAFFVNRGIPIDGIGFDFEVNGLRPSHTANLGLLFTETVKAMIAARPGSLVYYDTAPFRPRDGEGSTINMAALPYSLASAHPSLIARPMCYNGVVLNKSQIDATIDVATRAPSNNGGGGLTPAHLQCGIDVQRTSDANVTALCNLFALRGVGMTIYTNPGGAGAQKKLFQRALKWESALNPIAAAPGTRREPMQAPQP
jgi:hypothetical protein